MIVKNEMDKKVRADFQLWLSQWSDIPWAKNPSHNIYMKLYNVYKFANNYIELNNFLKNHDWNIEAWEEGDYLVRDVELIDKLLLRLPVKIRRNLLAAIQHYQKIELAGYLGCSNSHLTNVFGYNVKLDVKEDSLLPLARYLDAPYWFIRFDSCELVSLGYDEYINVKTISFLEFFSEINIEPGNIKFFKIKRSQVDFISPSNEYIYVKVISFSKFKVIETMDLNYEKEEIFDFINYGIRDVVRCIIVTPAILRKDKKVIYVLKTSHEEDSEEMISYISTIKKRKFTRTIELKSESY